MPSGGMIQCIFRYGYIKNQSTLTSELDVNLNLDYITFMSTFFFLSDANIYLKILLTNKIG